MHIGTKYNVFVIIDVSHIVSYNGVSLSLNAIEKIFFGIHVWNQAIKA